VSTVLCHPRVPHPDHRAGPAERHQAQPELEAVVGTAGRPARRVRQHDDVHRRILLRLRSVLEGGDRAVRSVGYLAHVDDHARHAAVVEVYREERSSGERVMKIPTPLTPYTETIKLILAVL